MYYTMNFFPLIVAVLSFLLFKKCFQKMKLSATANRLEYVMTIVLSLILSAFIIQGAEMVDEAPYNPLSIHLIIAIMFLAIPISIGLRAIWSSDKCISKITKSTSKTLSFKWCLLVFLMLTICWLPYFLASYPGLFCYDMATEYKHYATDFFTTHFPFLHVLFVGSIVDLGTKILGGGVRFQRRNRLAYMGAACNHGGYIYL